MKKIEYNWKIGLLLSSIVVLIFSISLRVTFIFYHAVFVDEFPNVSEAITFTNDLFKIPPNLNGLSFDQIKPVFYRLVFGISINIVHLFINKSSANLPLALPIATEYARLSMLFLNITCYLFLFKKHWKMHPLFSFFLILFVSLDPLLLFNTSIAETGAFIIPLMLVYIYLLSNLDLSRASSLIQLSITLALLESVQYYSVIFIVYAVTFIVIKWWFSKNTALNKGITFRRLALLLSFTILMAVAVFFAINPSYWQNPVETLRITWASVAFPLTSSSGVYELGVFFLGHKIDNFPPYVIFYYLILQVPIPVLSMFFIGLYFIFTSALKSKKIDYLTKVGLVSLLVFFGNFLFVSAITHFRGVGFLSVFLLPPLIVVSAIGVEKVLTSLVNYKITSSMFLQTIKIRSASNKINFKNTTAKLKKLKTFQIGKILALLFVVFLLASSLYVSSPDFTFSNIVGKSLYGSGANIDGSLDSGQADMLIADYMNSHNITNRTIISLAMTSDLLYYSPHNTYLQFWPTNNPVNSSFLISHYFSDYLVIDEYYSQLYGNPVKGNSTLFPRIMQFNIDGGYSILYHIGPMPTVNKSTIITSFSIGLINDSNKTTSSQYVQEIIVNSSKFASFELPNLTNVEFSYENGTIIPSYLESGNYYKDNSTIYYLQVDTPIEKFTSINIKIDFANEIVMNGYFVGGNPSLPGIPVNFNNGQYIFSYYHSFLNGDSSGYFTLFENSNATLEFGKGASFIGYGNSWAYLGSKVQIPVIDSVTMTSVSVGLSTLGTNSDFLLTPWNPNGTLPAFGIKIEDGQKYVFVNSNSKLLEGDITELYVELHLYLGRFQVKFFGDGLLPQDLIFSVNGTLIDPSTMAQAYEQYTFSGYSPDIFTVNYVFHYSTPLPNSEIEYTVNYGILSS